MLIFIATVIHLCDQVDFDRGDFDRVDFGVTVKGCGVKFYRPTLS